MEVRANLAVPVIFSFFVGVGTSFLATSGSCSHQTSETCAVNRERLTYSDDLWYRPAPRTRRSGDCIGTSGHSDLQADRRPVQLDPLRLSSSLGRSHTGPQSPSGIRLELCAYLGYLVTLHPVTYHCCALRVGLAQETRSTKRRRVPRKHSRGTHVEGTTDAGETTMTGESRTEMYITTAVMTANESVR